VRQVWCRSQVKGGGACGWCDGQSDGITDYRAAMAVARSIRSGSSRFVRGLRTGLEAGKGRTWSLGGCSKVSHGFTDIAE
jgi:hypothetical protein